MDESASLTKRQIAALFGVKLRQVELAGLTPASEVVPGVENLYYLTDVVAWYRDFVTGGKGKSEAELVRARADIAIMEREKMAGRLIESTVVHKMINDIIAPLRDDLARLPSESGMRGQSVGDVEWLEKRIFEVMDAAANRVLAWYPSGSGGNATASPDDSDQSVG